MAAKQCNTLQNPLNNVIYVELFTELKITIFQAISKCKLDISPNWKIADLFAYCAISFSFFFRVNCISTIQSSPRLWMKEIHGKHFHLPQFNFFVLQARGVGRIFYGIWHHKISHLYNANRLFITHFGAIVQIAIVWRTLTFLLHNFDHISRFPIFSKQQQRKKKLRMKKTAISIVTIEIPQNFAFVDIINS